MQQQEFSETIMVFRHKMYRFALGYLKDDEDAKDVVQDVLIKLWETRSELKEKQNIEAWCMSLTRNKALDRIKQVGRKRKSDLDEVHPEVFAHSFSPLRVVSDQESHEHITRFAAGLPEKQQATFQLRDMEGYSYLEIGEMLNIDINQVKVNIFRARKAIRENLEKLYSYGE